MPTNPNNKIFIHAGKRTHIVLMLVCSNPGYWGVMSISKRNRWDHNDLKKIVNKLIKKGLLFKAIPSKKLYATQLGMEVLEETNSRSNASLHKA